MPLLMPPSIPPSTPPLSPTSGGGHLPPAVDDAALQQAWQASALAQVQAQAQAEREREQPREASKPARGAGLYLQASEGEDQAARLRSVMAQYHAGQAGNAQGQPPQAPVQGPAHTRPVLRVTHSAMIGPGAGFGHGVGHGGGVGAGVVTHNLTQRIAAVAQGKPAAPVQAALPEPLACNVPVIAITSGKGGVGKSSISVNIAACLAQMRVRATLVDADPGLANADLLCGVSPTTRLDSVLAGGAARRGMGSIAVQTPAGFALVPGSAGLARMADLGPADRVQLLSSLCELEESSDALLIDTGAGLSQSVLAFVKHADFAVVVATPEPTSIADAYAIIKLLHAAKKPEPADVRAQAGALPKRGGVLLLINQANSQAEAMDVSQRIMSTCQRFLGVSPELLGWVVHDDAMRAAVRARTPVTLLQPHAQASKQLRALAAELALRAGLHVEDGERPVRAKVGAVRAFFGRVWGR